MPRSRAHADPGSPENFMSSYLSIFSTNVLPGKQVRCQEEQRKSKRRSPVWANAFSIELAFSARHLRQCYLATLRFVDDYLRRGFAHLDLGAHFLDLRGLLFQLRCEDFHSFLLLRNG